MGKNKRNLQKPDVDHRWGLSPVGGVHCLRGLLRPADAAEPVHHVVPPPAAGQYPGTAPGASWGASLTGFGKLAPPSSVQRRPLTALPLSSAQTSPGRSTFPMLTSASAGRPAPYLPTTSAQKTPSCSNASTGMRVARRYAGPISNPPPPRTGRADRSVLTSDGGDTSFCSVSASDSLCSDCFCSNLMKLNGWVVCRVDIEQTRPSLEMLELNTRLAVVSQEKWLPE